MNTKQDKVYFESPRGWDGVEEDPFQGQVVREGGQVIRWQALVNAEYHLLPGVMLAEKLEQCMHVSIEHKEREGLDLEPLPWLVYRQEMSSEEMQAYYDFVLESDWDEHAPWV